MFSILHSIALIVLYHIVLVPGEEREEESPAPDEKPRRSDNYHCYVPIPHALQEAVPEKDEDQED